MSNRDDLQTARAEIQNALGVINNSTANLRKALELIDKLLANGSQSTEQREEDKHKPLHEKVEFPEKPIATNLGSLVTAKQLGMIRALSRELRIDADIECNNVMKCRADELSKTAGSLFIKHLQEMQRPDQVERMSLRRAN